MWDPKVHVGTAAMVRDELGRYLMIRRSMDASHGAGQWSFPGGWIDFGEQPHEGVARECFEEAGIRVHVKGVVDAVSNIHAAPIEMAVCIFFDCEMRTYSPKPQIMEPNKADAMEWVHPEEMRQLNLFAPISTLLSKME